MLKLLYQTLRALAKRTIPLRLVRRIFELKAVTINGEGPQVLNCVSCGAEGGSGLFSVSRGGLVCQNCTGKAPDAIPLHPSVLYALQFIAVTPVEKLYTFTLKEEVLAELDQVTERYLERYVGRHFHSLEILEEMEAHTLERAAGLAGESGNHNKTRARSAENGAGPAKFRTSA